MSDVSLDDVSYLDLEFINSVQFGSHKSKDIFSDLFKNNLQTIYKPFLWLPLVDQHYYRLYYMQGFSQRHIKTLLDISQSAVGRRLISVQDKLKFLIRMPSLDPIQVKSDLYELLGDELWETALFYYWECNQTRVAAILETTPSGPPLS